MTSARKKAILDKVKADLQKVRELNQELQVQNGVAAYIVAKMLHTAPPATDSKTSRTRITS